MWVLALGTFLMGTSEFLVAGLLPQVAQDFHVSVARAGLTITVFAIGMIVGSPLVVLATLRLSRRSTLVALLVVFAVGHFFAAASTGFPLLLAARFATAMATGAFWAVAGLVAADAAGDGARTRALSVVQSGGMLANVAGVPLGTIAGQLAGWRGPFWALGLLAAGAAVVVVRVVPVGASRAQDHTIRSEFVALRSSRLWLVLATCAATTGGVLSVFSYVSPLHTDRTGLPQPIVPVALVLFGLAALVGALTAGRYGERRPYATTLVAGVATLLVVAALLPASTSPAPTLVLFTLLGFTGLSANPVLGFLAMRFGGSAPTLASALTPSAFLGTAIGTGTSSALLATSLGAIGPVLVGVTGAVFVLITSAALTLSTRP